MRRVGYASPVVVCVCVCDAVDATHREQSIGGRTEEVEVWKCARRSTRKCTGAPHPGGGGAIGVSGANARPVAASLYAQLLAP